MKISTNDMNILTICVITILTKNCRSEWILQWDDEFENQTFDANKWEAENELISCHGNYINQLNCNTNSTRNLRLIDGTLAITAIYEKYLNKNYTSARITTKQGFTYGRIEIRAALPKGKLLRSAFFMTPVNGSQDWTVNGQIDIMTNIQRPGLGSGLHYHPGAYETGRGDYVPHANLNDFHTYALEWDQFGIKWFFDDINYLPININKKFGSIYSKNGQPFDHPFRLVIHLGVGEVNQPSNILTLEDVIDWECSLLILDYVRVYRWANGSQILNSTFDSSSVDKICSAVMPLIRPKKKVNFALSTVVSVVTSISLIVLIPLVIFLIIRQNKLKRQNIKNENDSENYDDVCETRYSYYNTPNQNFDAYQDLNEYCVGNDCGDRNTDKGCQNENENCENLYLKMTSRK